MSTIKTLVNDTPVEEYISHLKDDYRREEALELLKIFAQATGVSPKMWGESIVGYGSYHYKSERSRQVGDWPRIGFSMRKNAISIYITPGFEDYSDLLELLRKHKTSKGCLYINKLREVDKGVLVRIIKRTIETMDKMYPRHDLSE